MSIFDSMKQSLLEAIKMEHGKDRRKEVIRELNLSEKEHRLITEYNHLIATGQFALAVEFLNENPRLLEDYINLLTDDKHKEVIDKMNEVPNNLYIEEERGQELIIEPKKGRYLCQHPNDSVIPKEASEKLCEFGKNPFAFLTEGMRDATPEEIESIDKHIKERSYPTGLCFWDNWHLNQNNEIDTYISEINSQDNFIAEINSLPMPETYPHEDDNFYIPKEYKDMSSEQLKNVKKAWDDYYKDREKMRKTMFGEGFVETFEDWGFTEEDRMEVERMINMKEIKIKYFTDKIEKLTHIGGSKRSNWIDLRAAETIELKAGDFKLIPLGVAMKLPEGYEAHIAPRSSTFKTWGILQCNSVGVVDQGYCGNDDQWMMSVYATRDTIINVNDRVCQFRIIENQPEIEFIEVEHMEDESRGGFGSSGKQ